MEISFENSIVDNDGDNLTFDFNDIWADGDVKVIDFFLDDISANEGYFVGYTGKGWGPGVYKGIDISETKIEQIVEEKGFLVGVINKIIHGIVQVEDFEMYPILEEENSPKVDFIGKLISDHPSIHCTLKERTVSGPTQGFNFKEE